MNKKNKYPKKTRIKKIKKKCHSIQKEIIIHSLQKEGQPIEIY